MSYSKSFQDNLLDNLAPIKRKLQNIRTKYLGTKSQVLRVTLESQDSFGGKTYSYSEEPLKILHHIHAFLRLK